MTSAAWVAIAVAALPGLWVVVKSVVDAIGKHRDPKNQADSASILTHAAAELATSYVNRMDQMEADHKATIDRVLAHHGAEIERIETKRLRDKDECDQQLLVLTTEVKTLKERFAAATAAASEKAELVAQIATLEAALAENAVVNTDPALREAVARLERSAERGEAAAGVIAADLANSQHRADQVTEGQPGEAADAGAQGPKENQ